MCLEQEQQEHEPKFKNTNPEIKKKKKKQTKNKTQKHFGPILNPLLGFLLPSSLLYSLSFPKEIMAKRGGGECVASTEALAEDILGETGDTVEGVGPVTRRRRRRRRRSGS